MNIQVNIKNDGVTIPEELIAAAGGDELTARIFFNRGYKDPAVVMQMLDDKLYTPTLPEDFPGMETAVRIIADALTNKEVIAVYGDYDVDGVTSTVTLVECLRSLGGNVLYHVPDRFTEGYGMNEEVVRELCARGVSLIITCDCGVSNLNEVAAAKLLGAKVIVTDHHNIPETLPPADVILNPKLLEDGHRARNISGCGMAFFLCRALLERVGCEEKESGFLDLLALSLVADVVSLNGENRYLLKKALPELFNSRRIGMKALFAVIEKNAKMDSEEDIAFQIAPRINAAGRMDSARLPVDLFLTGDMNEAEALAKKIDTLNRQRKKVQQEIIEQAYEMVENGKKNKAVLVLFNKFWHHGIIGIAAGKICEAFRKPAILLSMKEDGETVVGSARSTDDINIYELIKECSGRLLKFGGHSVAAGLSLDKNNIDLFTKEIENLAEKKYFIKDSIRLDVDRELSIDEIDEALYEKLRGIGPYGEGFEPPVFFARDVSVISDRKTEKNHHIMVVGGDDGLRLQAVKWFGEDKSFEGNKYDIVYSLAKNTYSGNSQLQLTLGHMQAGSGMKLKAFNGQFIDMRGVEISEILRLHEGAALFYEGLNDYCPIKGCLSRYEIRNTGTLIFVSAPVSTQVMKEVVYLANPQNIILNFSVLPDYSFKGFVFNFMSVLKHVIKNRAGRANIDELSVKLCVEEGIIISGLKYLKAAGKILYDIDIDGIQLYIEAVSSVAANTVSVCERNLRNALDEKNAYQKFLLKLEADRFKEYFKWRETL